MDQIRKRLLLVDDDSIDRQRVIRLLGPEYVAVQAKSATEAIEAQRTFRPDCALIDYRLPDMDGVDLVSRLAKEGLAIVMLTGEGDESVAVNAMKAGALDYVTKDQLDATRLETALSRAQERSRLETRLAETRQELEDFAAIVAHDVKSPLTTIVGYLQIVSAAGADTLPETEASFVERSREIAGGLIEMVDQLVRYTKTGRETTVFEEVDLNAAARTATQRLREAIDRSQAVVEIDELPVVRGVQSDLTQLLQNLIANAIKFQADGTPHVRVHVDSSNERELTIAVEDNGIGISEEHCETIFAPLKRLHTEKAYAGHGLGLATCRKIVRHHGGDILAKPRDGGGSVFRFTMRRDSSGATT